VSFSFSVRIRRGVGLADVLAAAGNDLSTVEDDLPAAGWRDGYTHVYLPGVSTRAVELSRGAEDLEVRLLTCSAPQEYALALSLATAAAELSGTQVRAEDGWEGPAGAAGEHYGPAWVAGNVASGARIALGLADNERGPIVMGGPVRDFHLGPRLAAELRAGGPEDGLPDRLLAAMRHTQWPGEWYYAASRIVVTGRRTGTKVTVAVWSGIDCVIPDVELVVLHPPGEGGSPHVRRESVPAFTGAHWSWLDERQLLLEAVPEDDWPAMRAAAEPYRVELPQ
jgi:hypothetical protein